MKPNLTIIGFGTMGQQFAKALKPYYNILIANRSDKSRIARKLGVSFTQDIKNSVKDADIVLLCVSISAVEKMIKLISPNLKPRSLVLDICSIKEKPMQIMKNRLNCDFIGTHPLFGEVDTLKNKKFVKIKYILCNSPCYHL